MAKKTKSRKVEAQSLGIYPGDWISINLRAQPYVWIKRGEDFVIRLDKSNPYQQIPMDITAEELQIIHASAVMGTIVKGKKRISPVDISPGVKDKYVQMLEALPGPKPTPPFKEAIKNLIINGNEGGISAKQILSDLRTFEQSNRNRADVVDYLTRGIGSCSPGLQIRYEAEDWGDKEEVVLTMDEVQTLVENTKDEARRGSGVHVHRVEPNKDDLVRSIFGDV